MLTRLTNLFTFFLYILLNFSNIITNMKKITLFLMPLLLGITLTNCSTNTDSKNDSQRSDSTIFSSASSSESSLVSSSSSSSASSSSQKTSSSSSSKKSSTSVNGYRINHTTATLTMGEELELSITNNGTKVNNITWTSSDNQLARVDSTGLVQAFFFTSANEIVTITGKVNNKTSLTCKLTINPRDESIFTMCYYQSQGVSQNDEGHVIYMFVHAGLEANGTLLVNKTFEYDSYTNICKIKVSKSYSQSGVDAYYIGKNEFYWGDYKNGLFYGQYSEVYNGTQRSALFSFNNIGFSYSSHTIVLQNSTTYRIEESDWSTIQDESTVALGVFYRIQECSEYAEEKFQEYNYGIHLF